MYLQYCRSLNMFSSCPAVTASEQLVTEPCISKFCSSLGGKSVGDQMQVEKNFLEALVTVTERVIEQRLFTGINPHF